MGALIRAHDWGTTSLGPPEAWPPALRTTVRLLLHTQHPMYIWWGPDLLCFYNDGYRKTLGPERHPSSLGRPGREVWAEIWDQIGDQVEFVMSGQGSTWDENRLVGSTRFGRLDEIYWTYSYSPIDDQRMPNGVGGVLVVCTETTQTVLSERRQAFRLKLEERLRSVSDPLEAVAAASQALGRHLAVDQVAYAEVEPGAETVLIEREWNSGAIASNARRHRLNDFGPAFIADLKAGQTIVIADVHLDARTSSPEAVATFSRVSIRAFLNVPIIKDGRLVAVLAVHSATPRSWSADEVTLVEEIGQRIWSAAERASAEEALRHREESQRLILESALDYAIFTLDENGIVMTWPPGAEAVFGWSAEEIIGQNVAMTFVPEDRESGDPKEERDKADHEGVAPNVRWHLRKDSRRIFIEGSTRPLRQRGQGHRSGYIKIGQDVTSRRETEQRQQVLVAELQHRTRNLMGVVRAMAARTAATASSLAEFMPRFKERLAALSRSNDLLARLEAHQRVTFDELIRTELKARGFIDDGEFDSRVKLDGPSDVRLRSAAVQIFALGIHELATNAVKHGALSDRGGTLRVSWHVRRDDAGMNRLVVEWVESGVSGLLGDAPSRENGGYGRTLIEKAMPYQLQAKTTYEVGGEGVRCTIDLPLN